MGIDYARLCLNRGTKMSQTKFDEYIESMNAQANAVDMISAIENYAPAFMVAYERGELVPRVAHADAGRLADYCAKILADEYEGNIDVGNIPPHDLEIIIKILKSVSEE